MSGVRAFPSALALVTIAALALRAWGLADAPILSDDRASGVSAVNLVERGQIGPTMWHHPRARDLAVYASMTALGATKLGLVLPSLVLGVVAVALVGLLGRRLAGETAGLVAGALLAIDAVHVDFSRQAVQEVYTTAFAAGGALLALRGSRPFRPPWLLGAGVVLGLGAASKWSVAFAAAALLAVVASAAWRDAASTRAERGARVAFIFVALGVVPVVAYAITWAPWLLAGHGLPELAELHRAMTAEIVRHPGYNAADLELPHRAATWFLWPAAYAELAFGADGATPFVAVANPVVWLAVLPAAAWAARRAWRQRDAGLAIALVLLAATYLPFTLTGRPIWVHSALVVLPFALVLVGAAVDALARRTARPRVAVVAYLAVAAIVAAPLYLLATGEGLRIPALRGAVEAFRPAAERPGG